MAFLKRKQICGIDDGLTSIAIIVRYGTGKLQDAMIDSKFFNSLWVLCGEPMRSSPHAHSLRESQLRSQLSALLWTSFYCSFSVLFILSSTCLVSVPFNIPEHSPDQVLHLSGLQANLEFSSNSGRMEE